MKKYILWSIIMLGIFIPSFAQTPILYEGFENSTLPVGWSQQYMILKQDGAGVDWLFQRGGREQTYPDTAAVGQRNACFIYQSYNNETTRLITPFMNLTGKAKPVLTFWHAQQLWGGYEKNDELRVYYSRSSDTTWRLMAAYTTAVDQWTFRTLQIPDSILDNGFRFAFEGKTKYGDGVCIDDVTVKETAVLQRRLTGIKVNQATTEFVASGTQDNPVLRIDFTIAGNTGEVPLQSLIVHSLCSQDSIIPTLGVKLYFTTDTFFNTHTPIGTAQSLSNGSATFSGLNQNLPFGLSSVWVAMDVSENAPQGGYIDASIHKQEIMANDTLYPDNDISPAGVRNLYSKIYFTGFETDPGWTMTGDFQRGTPQGLGGYLGNSFTGGNPDPTTAYIGSNVIGDDLTGINIDAPGNYAGNISEADANVALTPSFDLLYYKDINLSFYRWLNVYWQDVASVEATIDNGANWIDLWDNSFEGGIIADGSWSMRKLTEFSYLFERNPVVRFRFKLGPTTYTRLSSGWNIDNFLVIGNYVTKDIGVSSWQGPQDGCGLSNAEPVKIVIKNYGSEPISTPFQVSYCLKPGTTTVTETINSPIAVGDSIEYTFSQKADLSTPNVYANVMAFTSLLGDQDARNDTLRKVIYSLPYSHIALNSYYDNFEEPISLWRTYGNSNNSFACGTPNGPLLKSAASPVKCWKTYLNNYYYDNDSSFVEGPCFDFTGIGKAIFECKIWTATEPEHDGAVLQYSTDNGTSWKLVPKHPYAWKWNWYGDHIISALGTVGWDSISNGWVTAKQVLPDSVSNQPNVKFRFFFKSDAINNDEGFAFDDVKVYQAPKDVGVSSFDNLGNACQFVNSNLISIYVRNYGLNPLKAGDTIIAGIDVNSYPSIKDTFILSAPVNVNDSVKLTFTKPTNLDTAGTYHITAYTLIEATPRFYGTKNDTAITTLQVLPNPTTNMVLQLNSARPDTIILTPYYNSGYSYYWYYDGSTNSTLHLPSAGKYKVRVTNTGGNGCIAYDSTMVGKLTPDIGLDSILSPFTSCSLTSSEYIQVRFRNFGTDTLEVKDTIYVAFSFNGGMAVIDTVKLTQRLFPDSALLHTINKTSLDLHAIGAYNLKAWSQYRWDSIPTNDTLTRLINVWGFPIVYIGPDTTIAGLTDTLDAGPGFKTYTWNDGSHGQTYIARFMGNHWVTVTDFHDCPASDTAFIHLVIHDLSADMVTDPVSACSITELKQVKLQVLNSGTDTIVSGTNVKVGYKKDANAWVEENFILDDNLYPGNTLIHSFGPQEDFSGSGSHTIEAYVNLLGDIRMSNDTIRDTISIWGYPYVYLGADTFGVPALQYLLDAGTGPHYSYLWRDGSENQTYTVTSNGYYYVTVTDTLHGCATRDTIYVSLDINDIGITQLISDTVWCMKSFPGITVTIKNFGNNQYPIGKRIPVGYQLGLGSEVVDTLVLKAILPSNTYTNFTVQKFPLKPIGTNLMEVYTKMRGDLRPSNDTIRFHLTLKTNPTVELGGTNDSIKYINLPVVLDAGSEYISYLWNDGTTMQTDTVLNPGWFSVIVTDTTGCSGKDSVYLSKVTAVENISSPDNLLKVYPNPAKDAVTIAVISENRDDFTLELMNAQGELVMTRKITSARHFREQIDISHLARGIYFIKLYNSHSMHVTKIVLE